MASVDAGGEPSCRVGTPCDDGVPCTANDVCDAEGVCVGEPDNDRCMDELFCNGFEECRPGASDADDQGCVPGLALVAEDDGIACTQSVCDEQARTVQNVPGSDCECDTPSQPCEADGVGDCQAAVCTPQLTCEVRSCEALYQEQPCIDAVCDAGSCTRVDRAAGDACDDGIECTRDDTCETVGGSCAGTPDNSVCDDGAFCNGAEVCGAAGCEAGVDATAVAEDQRACVEHTCDEETDQVTSDDSLCGVCEDTTLYADVDDDGFGEMGTAQVQCLPPEEGLPPGLVTMADDCADDDPWRNPGSSEICFDFVDDDCDGSDTDDCELETQQGLGVPDWDCNGQPPANVYAHAALGAGQCFVFFSSPAGAIFGAPLGTDTVSCGNWDVRLYAFMLAGNTDDCPPIRTDVGWPSDVAQLSEAELEEFTTQPVSNRCRKYAHQLRDSGPFSYIAGDREEFDARAALFPSVEIACLGYNAPYSVYGWNSLAVGALQFNAGWAP